MRWSGAEAKEDEEQETERVGAGFVARSGFYSPSPQPLSRERERGSVEQLVEGLGALGEKLRDRRWRLANLYFITNKQGERVRFQPNWAQAELLERLACRNVDLKVRQLGVTTGYCMLWLDAILFNRELRVGIVAHTKDDAKIIFRDKIKYAYDNLPAELRARLPARKCDSGELLLENGSGIRVGVTFRSGTVQSSIETTAADLFHAAIARFQQFGSAIAAAAKSVDQVAEAAAPVATAVLAVVAPQDVAAVTAAKALLNAADAAIESVGGAAGNGVSLSLPAALVQDWQAAKAALIAFEQSL